MPPSLHRTRRGYADQFRNTDGQAPCRLTTFDEIEGSSLLIMYGDPEFESRLADLVERRMCANAAQLDDEVPSRRLGPCMPM